MLDAAITRCREEVEWRVDGALDSARGVGDLAELLAEIEGWSRARSWRCVRGTCPGRPAAPGARAAAP